MDNKWYDERFVKAFTDFPLLIRADNLKRLRASDVFPNYTSTLPADSPSRKVQGITDEQHQKLGDYVVWDSKTNGPKALTRDMVGETLWKSGIDPTLDGTWKIKLVDGSEVEVKTAWTQYQVHLKDYDVDSVSQITSSPKELILQLAKDIATIKPVCFRYEIKEGPKVFETEIRGKKFEMFDDTIIGYSKDGTKIIETKVEEPFHVRPDKHANSI